MASLEGPITANRSQNAWSVEGTSVAASDPARFAADGKTLLTVGTHTADYNCDDALVWDMVLEKIVFGLKRASFCAAITPAGNQMGVTAIPLLRTD